MSTQVNTASAAANCQACKTNTCTEVYHKQVRDEGEKKGILGKVGDAVENAYEKVTGKANDPEYQMKKEINRDQERAEKLSKEGHSVLKHTDKDMKKAEEEQRRAAEQAARANEATRHALDKQVEGQDKLAMAGQKMMSAGAKMQQQAAMSGTAGSVPINVHQTGQVHQQTGTTGQSGAVAAAAAANQGEYVVRQTEATGRVH
jgi:hypothetical protein